MKRVFRVADWLATATCIAALAILGVYASDREPPFAVREVSRPAGAPGQEIVFRGTVWRDHARKCSAERFASAYHSDGVRTDYPMSFFSAEQIAHQEEKTPGRMAPAFTIPSSAEPGRPAYMSITLRYYCNTAHKWFEPIEVRHIWPFDVVEPK